MLLELLDRVELEVLLVQADALHANRPFFPNLEAAGDAGYGVDGGELARRRAIALLVSPAPQARTICVRHINECG